MQDGSQSCLPRWVALRLEKQGLPGGNPGQWDLGNPTLFRTNNTCQITEVVGIWRFWGICNLPIYHNERVSESGQIIEVLRIWRFSTVYILCNQCWAFILIIALIAIFGFNNYCIIMKFCIIIIVGPQIHRRSPLEVVPQLVVYSLG